jgi:integrase
LTGKDRAILYLVALSTGWRAGGIANLRVHNFLTNGLVILEARYSKNRREQRKFLPDSVRKTVADYLQDKSVNEIVWPGNWYQNAAEMLRIDLKAAGINPKTDEGILDFHSFRNTSITWMLESGTPIYLVQRHADHANPSQTMRYARPKKDDVDDAVERTFSLLNSLAQTTENKVSEKSESAIIPEKALKHIKGPREDA